MPFFLFWAGKRSLRYACGFGRDDKIRCQSEYLKNGIGKPIPSFLQYLQDCVTKDAENGVKTYKNCKSAMK